MKFQLIKSNRINEKLQASLDGLKEENAALEQELTLSKEEIQVAKESMADLKNDYDQLIDKAGSYDQQIEELSKKYSDLLADDKDKTVEIKRLRLNKSQSKSTEKEVSSLRTLDNSNRN